MSIAVVHTVADLRARMAAWRASGERVALVPTMGALHTGHLSLVALGRQKADRVVATIFVNPKQFGPGEDFGRYPRTLPRDADLLSGAKADLLFAPDVAEVYPPGFSTTISIAGLGDRLCGAARPGHFDGVATVVAKLLIMALPDMAIFGEKDWQQLAIIRRLVRDLNLPVDIAGGPIVRDADGLALSSRNQYLDAMTRSQAAALPRALSAAVNRIERGEDVGAAIAEAKAAILAGGFDSIDYVELCGSEDLQPMAFLDRPARLLAAARLAGTRLIDNMAVGEQADA